MVFLKGAHTNCHRYISINIPLKLNPFLVCIDRYPKSTYKDFQTDQTAIFMLKINPKLLQHKVLSSFHVDLQTNLIYIKIESIHHTLFVLKFNA